MTEIVNISTILYKYTCIRNWFYCKSIIIAICAEATLTIPKANNNHQITGKRKNALYTFGMGSIYM